MDAVRSQKVLATIIFLVCGTISTIGMLLIIEAFKLQNSQYVEEGGKERKFFHPYMQAWLMFLGESLCIWIYLFNRKKKPLPLQEGKTPHKFYYFLVPALSDSCSSIFQYMGLNLIAGSTYLMFKGASIVTTAIFSKILFGMIIEKRHWIGCGLAVVGLAVVGSSGFLLPSSQSQASNQFLGYTMMLISLVFNGFYYAYEQFLMKKHTIDPLQMVGCQGCFGMFIIAFISLILSICPCSFDAKLCVLDSFGNPYFERVDVFFSQVFTDVVIALLVVVGVMTVSAYNLNGVRITKMIDALTRSLLNITKTSLVWIVGIVVTFSVGDNTDYQLESKDVWVNLVKAAGFACIVVGTLIYNKLLFRKWLEGSSSDKNESGSQGLLGQNERDSNDSNEGKEKEGSIST